MEDHEIIDLLYARDELGLQHTQRKYDPLYRAILRQLLTDKADVDECCNDVLLSVWNSIPPHKPTALRLFLGKIVRNTAIDRYRQRKTKGESFAVTLEELAEILPAREEDDGHLGMLLAGFLEDLSPEEAARDRYAREEAEENDGFSRLGFRIRDNCLHIGQNRNYPMGERTNFMVAVLGYGRSYPDFTFAEWAEILLDTEELDPARRELFASLATLTESPDAELMEERGLPYEKLLCYFLYRYLANEGRDFMEWGYLIRIGFAILSTILIHAMARATGETSFEELCEIARIYSSEIEYSEENLDCLWDIIREDTVQPPKDRHE